MPERSTKVIYTEPLFLGITPSGARNYVAHEVASLKKPFFNPCAGRFTAILSMPVAVLNSSPIVFQPLLQLSHEGR
jgi:hypothetical protein